MKIKKKFKTYYKGKLLSKFVLIKNTYYIVHEFIAECIFLPPFMTHNLQITLPPHRKILSLDGPHSKLMTTFMYALDMKSFFVTIMYPTVKTVILNLCVALTFFVSVSDQKD